MLKPDHALSQQILRPPKVHAPRQHNELCTVVVMLLFTGDTVYVYLCVCIAIAVLDALGVSADMITACMFHRQSSEWGSSADWTYQMVRRPRQATSHLGVLLAAMDKEGAMEQNTDGLRKTLPFPEGTHIEYTVVSSLLAAQQCGPQLHATRSSCCMLHVERESCPLNTWHLILSVLSLILLPDNPS